jgi:putative transposase
MLQLWAELGVIRLKYLDESGCYCQSSTNYSYSRRGSQKRLRQTRRRGRRINILGVWEPQSRFDYALMLGTMNSDTYVALMEWQATQGQQHLQLSGQPTVIVQDNASVHRSQSARQHHLQWQEQGLFFFFLPPYNPQRNRIEDEWLHIKRDELACRVFEDEYELAQAII